MSGEARELPPAGSGPGPVGAFLDTRGGARALRVTWHRERAPHGPVVVLSIWRGDVCAATFRLTVDEVPDLVEALRAGLDVAYDDAVLTGRATR